MIISKAPLRISLFGGGTDYPEYFASEGGAVLGMAIDKFAYITANRFHGELFDYSIRLAYREVELVKSVADISHRPFRETLRYCGIDRNIELNYMADLPAFTGLGSSSSFTVALLQALHAYCGRYRSGLELAYEAIYLERHVFGDCVGCQDQVLAAVGGLNIIEFRAEDDIVVHRIALAPGRLTELRKHMLVFFTGIRRSASKMAGKQLNNIDVNRASLRKMRTLVDRGHDILVSRRPISDLGELLHDSWTLKSSLDNGVSNPAIDAMYNKALEAGALGGKLLGAGGGGFLMMLVRPEDQSRVRAALSEYPTLDVGIGVSGCQLLPGDGHESSHAEAHVGRHKGAVTANVSA